MRLGPRLNYSLPMPVRPYACPPGERREEALERPCSPCTAGTYELGAALGDGAHGAVRRCTARATGRSGP